MKKYLFIVISLIFFRVSFTAEAQDSLFFPLYPGQKYIFTEYDIRVGGGGGQWNHAYTGEVAPYGVINGNQYYNHPFLGYPVLLKGTKLYWLQNGAQEIFITDFSFSSGTNYQGSIPASTNLTLTVSKSSTIFKLTSANDELYFELNKGPYHKRWWYEQGNPLPIYMSSTYTLKELRYQNPDGSFYYFRSPFTVYPGVTIDDTVETAAVKVAISAYHPYTRALDPPDDFWASVKGYVVYKKPGYDSVTVPVFLSKTYQDNYSGNLMLDTLLMLNGYTAGFAAELTDKCLIPNTFRFPASGYYSIKYVMVPKDFYTRLPDLRNTYQRWEITGSDTTFTGEVEQKFLPDQTINSIIYMREELFGDTLFFKQGNVANSYNFYRKQGSELTEIMTEGLFFSATDSVTSHYFDPASKLLLVSFVTDTTGGYVSRLYSLKGGLNGEEELKFKARVGPVRIVRFESDGAGGKQKVLYNLIRMNNQGITTSNDEAAVTPEFYTVSENYPNPFNPSTTVRVSVSESAVLTYTLFNSSGERISAFTREYPSAGEYQERFDLTGYPSGVWFLTVTDANGVRIKMLKLALLK